MNYFTADDDVDTYEYICEAYTWTGACPKGSDCPHYHSPHRHPYLWLKLEDGHPPSVSVVFEERFCAVDDIFVNKVNLIFPSCIPYTKYTSKETDGLIFLP